MSKVLERFRKARFHTPWIRLSAGIIALLLVAVSIFILGGGVYDVIEARLGNLVAILPTPSYPRFYYTGLTDQTFNESAYFILFLVIGISGGYVCFRSSRHAFRPREARMLLLIGIGMLAVATVGCEVMLSLKGL